MQTQWHPLRNVKSPAQRHPHHTVWKQVIYTSHIYIVLSSPFCNTTPQSKSLRALTLLQQLRGRRTMGRHQAAPHSHKTKWQTVTDSRHECSKMIYWPGSCIPSQYVLRQDVSSLHCCQQRQVWLLPQNSHHMGLDNMYLPYTAASNATWNHQLWWRRRRGLWRQTRRGGQTFNWVAKQGQASQREGCLAALQCARAPGRACCEHSDAPWPPSRETIYNKKCKTL